jgi:hypothetical protein
MFSTKLSLRLGAAFAVPATCASALLFSAGGASAASLPITPDTSQPSGQVWVLTNLNSGMVADDPNWSTQSGTAIDQWPANGGDNQAWVISASGGASGGDFTISNRYSGLCLTDPGTMQSGCGADSTEEWRLTWTGPMNNGHRHAQLQNVFDGGYLTVTSDSTSAATALTVTDNASDPAAAWDLGLTGYTFLSNAVTVPEGFNKTYNDWTQDTDSWGPPLVGYNCQTDYHFRMSSGQTPVYQATGDAQGNNVYPMIWADPAQLFYGGWIETDPADADAGRGHLTITYNELTSGSQTGQIQVYCDVNSGVNS